ncbi:hypothetical protein OROHE_017268 [Orobanche hederae]
MDWKSKVILIVGLYVIVLRLRMKVMLLWYCIIRERHQQYRKRKRSKRYSMIKKIPKQIEHLSNLVRENDTVCIEQLRMDRNAFGRLCQILRNAGGLEDEKYVSLTEQVALFLHILAHHKKNVSIKLYYKRSGATVSLYFNRTLDAFLRLYHMFLARPEPITEDSVDPVWKYFPGCLGALDGTHVKVRVPLRVKNRYRSRKGEISTNVLAVCNKYMNFIYVLSGWEGSAADSRVLRDAMSREPGLQVPEGCYYLGDGGYANCEGFLTPYRGRRYHLSEWGEGDARLRNYQEYFNMRHAKARNIIERSFEKIKGRWACLRSNTFYPIDVQNKIIMACCLLHNFIRFEMAVDPIEDQFNKVPESVDNNDYIDNVEPSDEWSDWRDNLAIDMYNEWRDRMDSQTSMQIPQEKLGRGRRQKAPKRFWSKNEELVCIGVVKELIKGGWRSGNGWRGGFYSAVKDEMKKEWIMVSDVANLSGFNWDHSSSMILAEHDELWNALKKNGTDVDKTRGNAFPYYEDWCEIFGKDRATGEKACDFSTNEKRDSEKRNAEKIEGEKISRSKENDKVFGYDTYFTDCYFVQDEDGESDHVKIVSPTAGGGAKKKKMDHSGVIDDSLNVMMNSFMNETKEALLGLNRSIEKLCNGDPNAALAMAALKNISSLSQIHRIEGSSKARGQAYAFAAFCCNGCTGSAWLC